MKMARAESEMSLGLNRSESINDHLSELGEFCQTGQIIGKALTYSIGFASLLYLIYIVKSRN
jgi:hypothetical protein